jgi:(R,R)-butanediol dehydrogenase/meso-butanediol dehydrogenase/diacetyl reductase
MPPQILGHEFSGTVVELGDSVDGYEVGDRVAVWPVYYCGHCAACVGGRFNVCQRIGFHGLSSNGGGMAEFTTVAADKLHKLPDNVDLRMGALVEPMAVSWHAVSQSEVEPGQSVLIAGAGPIGIGIWFALRARGVERIVVSEPSLERRGVMSELGADALVDPTSDDLAVELADVTSGQGVDVAFDAAGAGVAVSSAIGSLTPGGRLVVVALHERGFDFNPTTLVMAETSIVGALAYMPRDFDDVIAAMAAGTYNTDGWVEEISVDDVVDAFRALRQGHGMKMLVSV